MKKTVLMITASMLACAPVHAQDAEGMYHSLATPSALEVGVSVGNYHYDEDVDTDPGFMNIDGNINAGVQASYTHNADDIIFGSVEYSGAMGYHTYKNSVGDKIDDEQNVKNEVRGLIGKDLYITQSDVIAPYIGLGHRWLYDDGRGYAPVSAAEGYRRLNKLFYAPIGMTYRTDHFGPVLEINGEYDYLIRGTQKSYLSDTGSGVDTTNKQDSGFGVRTSAALLWGDWTYGLAYENWQIEDSKINGGIYEPENSTTEYRVFVSRKFDSPFGP